MEPSTLKTWLSTRLVLVPIAIILSTMVLWIIVLLRPNLDSQQENLSLTFPSSLQDVKNLFQLFTLYKEKNYLYVLLLFSSGYIYKQTFAIPGSALLNVLAGAVFGCWPIGLFLCCILTTIGASNCYLLSRYSGKAFIKQKFPAQIAWLKEQLDENSSRLFLFLISLRLFPATPNWLINMVAPVVNVPLPLFSLSIFIGLIPYNFLCVKTGETLSEIESFDQILTTRSMCTLFALALVVWFFSTMGRKSKAKFS